LGLMAGILFGTAHTTGMLSACITLLWSCFLTHAGSVCDALHSGMILDSTHCSVQWAKNAKQLPDHFMKRNWHVINLGSGLRLAISSSRACVQRSNTQSILSMTVVRPAFGASRTSSYTRALVLASMRILYDAVGLVAGRPVALQTQPNILYQQFLVVSVPLGTLYPNSLDGAE